MSLEKKLTKKHSTNSGTLSKQLRDNIVESLEAMITEIETMEEEITA